MVGFTNTLKKKYNVIPEGNRIKFKKSSKYDYDFKKGQFGIVKRILSPFPSATDTIYQVLPDNSKETVWVVGEDIESFDQLEIDLTENKPKSLCPASLYVNSIFCIRNIGHEGSHRSSGGLEWDTSRPKNFYDAL